MGFNLLRLRVYLLEHKFKPSEYRGMDKTVIEFGRAYAYGLVSYNDMKDSIGITEGSFTKMLMGQRGASKPVLEVLKRYLDPIREKLRPIEEPSGKSTKVHIPAVDSSHSLIENFCSLDKTKAFDMLANGIQTIGPLAEFLASDACTPEMRTAFRERCGTKVLLNVSTALTKLLGETARRLAQQT